MGSDGLPGGVPENLGQVAWLISSRQTRPKLPTKGLQRIKVLLPVLGLVESQ